MAMIQDEISTNNPYHASEFPRLMTIQSPINSFYIAIGYSILTQLCRVKPEMRRQPIRKIRDYLESGLNQQGNNLTEEGKLLEIFLKEIEIPTPEIQTFSFRLRENSSIVCSSFQIILAEIFSRSYKEKEAQGILNGEVVPAANKYYFENFSKSLCIQISLYRVDDPNPQIYRDDANAERVNVNIYVSVISPPTYAIMRHSKEIEFDESINKPITDTLPFIAKYSAVKTPNEPIQSKNNSNTPNPVKFEPISSKTANLTDEEFLTNQLFAILTESHLLTTMNESKQLRELLKKVSNENPNLKGEHYDDFYEMSKIYCKKNHDPSEFVIFKSCKKRHCKKCLQDNESPQKICDCKKILNKDDCLFHFKTHTKKFVVCVWCDLPCDEGTYIEKKPGKFAHKSCS